MPTVDGTVGVSRSTLDEVVRLYGDNGPSVAIPNGVDAEALKAIEPRECTRRSVDTAADAPVVVFLGHLGQQKRPDRFLRVMERVKRQIPEVRGWVLGDGPMHDELIEQARDLDLSETIHFVGYQSEVARFIHAADVLLVTSDSDGIPAVVLESALLGRPAVATDVGGMRECVRHGETGYLESPDEEEELAARVVELLRDAELRDRFGEKAREWAMDAFVMTRIAERYLDFYNRARKMPSIDAQ